MKAQLLMAKGVLSDKTEWVQGSTDTGDLWGPVQPALPVSAMRALSL